jgi:hypothetical protein
MIDMVATTGIGSALQRWAAIAVALLCWAVQGCAETGHRAGADCAVSGPPVIGWAESVRLPEVGIERTARIDTGADLASLDATIVRIVKGDGPGRPDRVVFTIADGQGGTRTLETAIVDWVAIKNKGAPGSTRRPVVAMTLCLAGRTISGGMSLADRSGFDYPILVGRDILRRGGFLVDSQRRLMHHPGGCRD